MTKEIAGVSRADIVSGFERFNARIPSYEEPIHRRFLRGYLLHSLLVASSRHDELPAFALMADDAEYAFFDSGKRISGSRAIVDFHRQRAKAGMLTLPTDQRIAVADWGFAAEQTDFTTFIGNAGAPTARRTRTAMVWRSDGNGRLSAARFYPAARHEDLEGVSHAELLMALPDLLAPLIAQVAESLRSI